MPRPPPRIGNGLLPVLLRPPRPKAERPPRPKGEEPGGEAGRVGNDTVDRMMKAMETMMMQTHGPEERLMLVSEEEGQEAARGECADSRASKRKQQLRAVHIAGTRLRLNVQRLAVVFASGDELPRVRKEKDERRGGLSAAGRHVETRALLRAAIRHPSHRVVVTVSLSYVDILTTRCDGLTDCLS